MMKADDVLIILGAVFLVLIFAVVAYSYAIDLKKRLDAKWIDLYVVLRKKLDMTPLLIEIVKQFSKEKILLNETVKARGNAYFDLSDENIAELDFMIKRLLELEKKNNKLKYDLNFLEFKNCFVENCETVRRAAVDYNIAVAKYNGIARIFARKAPLFQI